MIAERDLIESISTILDFMYPVGLVRLFTPPLRKPLLLSSRQNAGGLLWTILRDRLAILLNATVYDCRLQPVGNLVAQSFCPFVSWHSGLAGIASSVQQMKCT